MSYTPPPPGPDNYVVAWDSKGPIEVEMIVGCAGKKLPIKGPTVIQELSEKQPHISDKPTNTFHGLKFIT